MIAIRKARLTDMKLIMEMEREFDRDQRQAALSREPTLQPYLRRLA
jgi:hypothetical protein